MEIKLKKIGVNCWQVQTQPEMRAEAIIYAKKELLDQIYRDQSLLQLIQSASLPKVISPVVAMPDVHEGFGLPIGGVMATDGLVSSGAVGMDINCGVRLLTSKLKYDPKNFSPEILRLLIHKIEREVPIGLGGKHRQQLGKISFAQIITQGARALVKNGFATPADIESIEENGCLSGADLRYLSPRAIKRAEKELGTLGSGNHFIEIQVLKKIFDPDLAKKWGLFEGQICVMIHTGSRALGHQTCLDYTQRFFQEEHKYGIKAPVRNLASLPADSPTGAAYLSAMAGCVNFAFANRQLITHFVRQAFSEILTTHNSQLTLLYDVAHNIAKWEEHQGKKVLVHRKGATRALPAGHPLLPEKFKETGQPAIVPGSMGTASYVMVGLPSAVQTFYSINHGAGRTMSRGEAIRTIKKEDFEQKMGTIIYNMPFHKIVDEAPQAYKDIDLVVETLVEAGLTKKVCRLEPLAVIKGD
ncbi:MAG: RtcB family protein [Microgenomates group bacterium]